MALVLQQPLTPHHRPGYPLTHTRVPTGWNVATVQDGPTGQPQQPRHLEFADFNHRLFSFRNWEFESVQSSRLLATNGFFSTGEGDLVRCYNCSLGLKDFMSTSDPLLEHYRYSPDCTVVLQQLHLQACDSHTGEKGEHIHKQTVKNQFPPASDRQAIPPPVKHPQYESYSARLDTYTSWHLDKRQTPRQLAEAGFYYIGYQDIVSCFTCGGSLKSWDPLDDPWIEHARHFPHCSYIKQIKGEDYVPLVHRYYQELIKPELTGISASGARIPTSTSITERLTRPNEPQLPRDKTTREQLLDMGFSEKDVNKAVDTLSQAKIEVSVERVLEEMERLNENNSTKYHQAATQEDLVEEYTRLKHDINCKVCLSSQSNVLFLPCQHHCCCTTCSELLVTCPLCCVRIQQKVKTFS